MWVGGKAHQGPILRMRLMTKDNQRMRYYDQFYANIFNNIDEIDKSLERYSRINRESG
jgi:hypothetical protein